MNNEKLLVISDAGNQSYWQASALEMKKFIGSVDIVLDENFLERGKNKAYDLIIVDISDLTDLMSLIPQIHALQPKSRIIVATYTPTWKQAREVIHLGAAKLIRKSSNLDEFFKELQPL